MIQRLRPKTPTVALSLVLAAGAIVAAACGSDDEPASDASPLTGAPTAGASNSGAAGAAAGPSPTGAAGSDPVAAAGAGAGEAPPTDVPLDPTPPAEPGAGGATSEPEPPVEEPPAPTGLAPNCNPPEGDVPNLALEVVAEGLNQPIYVTGVPGDDSRLIILERPGVVRVMVDGVLQEAPFVDIAPQVSTIFEGGLLGIAFHPSYAENGLFYLHYSSNGGEGLPPTGDTVVAEFQVDPNDRSLANAASRRIVLTATQPMANHNGGELTFGPDGMLYLGLGDGGGGNDPDGNGQNLSTPLGKLLRIDPTGRDVNNAYSIPDGNLAAATGQQALPEIWAYGLRNPWRFSFDACTGDLYIGDVGQNSVEEIDFVAADPATQTIAAGANFGWNIMEGPTCFQANPACNQDIAASLTLPIDSYGRDVGGSVNGGFVYRGSRVPGLRGHYIYSDYNTGRFFRFREQDGQAVDKVEITEQLQAGVEIDDIVSFGADNAGEVYVTAFDPGTVYRIVAAQ